MILKFYIWNLIDSSKLFFRHLQLWNKSVIQRYKEENQNVTNIWTVADEISYTNNKLCFGIPKTLLTPRQTFKGDFKHRKQTWTLLGSFSLYKM